LAREIFISAGEASGEAYGAQLITAARALAPDARFFGLGGAQMRAAGCDVTVASHEVAVVGLVEVVRHLPSIYARYRKLLREIDRRKPAAAVLIDFPDFNFRLARQLHKRGIPVVYFVSPQLWAWRQSRLELVKKYVTKMLVIFPFEETWYRERGVPAEYAGHPLVDALPQRTASKVEHETYAKKWGLDPNKQWIALLPGSRKGEVERHGYFMYFASYFLGAEYEYLLPVATGLDPNYLRAWVLSESACEGYVIRQTGEVAGAYRAKGEHVDSNPDPKIVLVDDAQAALRHARAAVVASGTATVEAALIGTPMVVVYRLSGLTWRLGRRLVKLDHFAMPNLIAGRRIVPELIQDDFTAENVVRELRKIIPDGPDRQRMLTDLAEVRAKLKPTGTPPAQRAAQVVLGVAQKAHS
jgi:lipid-A-disaccharide synthase